MAFKKVEKGGDILKPESLKRFVGYYTGFRVLKSGTGKNKRESVVHKFKSASGENTEVWGCGYLNNVLLDGKRPSGAVIGKLCRVTYKGKGKAKKGQTAPKILEVEVDSSKSLK